MRWFITYDYRQKVSSLRKRRAAVFVIGGLFAIALVVFGGLWIYQNAHKPLISKDITSQVNYTLYVPPPRGANKFLLDKTTIEYDKTERKVAMTARSADNKITFTVQPQPDAFTDVPGFYAKLLNTLNPYKELSTSIGTVTLTRPQELNGGQTAVVNPNGTLIFAHPDKDISDQDWQEFFNNLKVIK